MIFIFSELITLITPFIAFTQWSAIDQNGSKKNKAVFHDHRTEIDLFMVKSDSFQIFTPRQASGWNAIP